MKKSARNRRTSILISRMVFGWAAMVITVLGLLPARSFAQEGSAQKDEGWWGVITESGVSMRCARSERFYEIGKLDRGTVVRVMDVNEAGWAQIKPPPGLTGFALAKDFSIVEDGKYAIAPAETTGYYPLGDDPTRSWKKFVIEEGAKLRVLERIEVPQKLFLRIEMPENVPCAVVASFIRRATPEEVDAWHKQLEEKAEAAGAEPEDEAEEAVGEGEEKTSPPPVVEQPDELVSEKAARDDAAEEQSTEVAETDQQPGARDVAASETGEAMPPSDQADAHETIRDKTEMPAEPEADDDPAEEGIELTEQPAIEDLESMYEALKEEDILDAEIEPVLEGYRAIAEDASQDGADRRLARARIVLLELRLKHQESRRRILQTLAEAESRIQEAVQQNDEMIRAGAGSRVLVGKLSPSSVYDGRRLPLRYRLRDPITGRTMVYIAPKEEGQLLPYLDSRVRVVGRIIDDPALNVRLMELLFIENTEES